MIHVIAVQVLSKAMEHWNLSCTNLDSPEATESKAHPENEQAFICNLQAIFPLSLFCTSLRHSPTCDPVFPGRKQTPLQPCWRASAAFVF